MTSTHNKESWSDPAYKSHFDVDSRVESKLLPSLQSDHAEAEVIQIASQDNSSAEVGRRLAAEELVAAGRLAHEVSQKAVVERVTASVARYIDGGGRVAGAVSAGNAEAEREKENSNECLHLEDRDERAR